ncbi:MAG: FAD-dependent oxidoreductase [Gammaproteobacteria bacterium]|nr:FAD-dependent oxidoreductase [Gammaproteobacteria bacterium]
MKVVVLGAGIAGITTAWYLASGGAEVTVIDRAGEAAAETSHANGGHLSTQSGVPWTSPSGLHDFLFSRFTPERTIRVRRRRDPGRFDWFVRALSAARPAACRRASARLTRLADFSRASFEALCAESGLDVSLEERGTLALYRSERAFARARKQRARGVRVFSHQDVLSHEPALAGAAVPIAGALHYPGDATGDCRRFCMQLGERSEAGGVVFRQGENVHRLHLERGVCRGVETDGGHYEADACVAALGAQSACFLRPWGIRLPILPLRGYTLTAPIDPAAPAPGGFSDPERHLVFSRLGPRFRAAGMADFTGLNEIPDWGRGAQLERIVREWYPALSCTGVEHWSCLRPMTPDGPPILGASGIPGLWLNTGLGPLGWTLGCGAGRIVADLVLGKKPPIDSEGLTCQRFHRFAKQDPTSDLPA